MTLDELIAIQRERIRRPQAQDFPRRRPIHDAGLRHKHAQSPVLCGDAAGDYHTMIAGVLIADEIANIVHRHKHLRAELKHALDALASIADRVRQRTVDDAYWSATQEEADSLDLAVEIYKDLMISTPGQMVRRAMLRVNEQLKSGERNVHNRA